jgi:cytochrome P450
MSAFAFDPPRQVDAPSPPLSALAHIPGSEGWPVVGITFDLLADPKGAVERMVRRYGPVYRGRAFGERNVSLLGPDANEFVFLDTGKLFSSRLGWNPYLERLFPRGLMMLDFDEHRLHRRAISVAFKSGPMKSYLQGLNAGVTARIGRWPRQGEVRFYPAVKQMTLDLAANSFLGIQLGPEVEWIKRAFSDMVAASVAVVRAPIPGTTMYRGVKARDRMFDHFCRQIGLRRDCGGDDIFSHLCRASHEDGSLLSPEDIANHMSFLMMAAHDTLASSLTSLVYRLATNTDWQERLRDEVSGLQVSQDGALMFDQLDDMVLTEMAFKEAMRLTPPVPSVPRRALRDFEFKGFRIPAGTAITVNPLYTHYMSDFWPDPERYDPMRFTEAAARNRHKFAFVPFGGGAHMCIGLNFAYMQAKCFMWHFLRNFVVSIPPYYRPKWQLWPIPKPRDGLKIILGPVR